MRHKTRLTAIAFILLLGCALSTPLRAHAQDTPQVPPSPGAYLDLHGSKIYYEECGSGPSIVLLHDGLINSATWDNVWAPLCAKFHVLRYDRRGFGRSDTPSKPFSPTEDLLALLQHLHVPRAIIVGNSSGGALAIDFALDYPRMVDGLFLIGPVVHGMQDSAYFSQRGDKNNEPLARGDVKAAAENWSKDRFLIAPGHDAARKQFLDALMKFPQSLHYPGNLEIRPSPSAATRLSQVQAPVFLMVGEFDIADVHSYCGAIQNGVPESARLVVNDAGHLVQLDHPDVVIDRLTRFAVRASRKVASVPPAALAPYAGQYKLGDSAITVIAQAGRLLIRLPNLPDVIFYPQSDATFFTRIREIDLEFEKDSSGKVTQMDIHQAGGVIKCPRM